MNQGLGGTMSNDQEPIPKMQASQEDMAMRQKKLQQRRLAAQREAKSGPVATRLEASAPKQTLATVALVLSLAVSGFAGFLFMQLQEANAQLGKAESILNGHSTNLNALNDKLSASDENSNLSDGVLKILLKDNSKEIRKLWDLSNKKNKPSIADNTKNISAVKESIIKTYKKATEIDNKATQIDKKSTEIDKKIVSANSNISGNKDSIAALKTSLANSQQSLEAKFAEVKLSMASLPAASEKRIADTEQSIRSIDATRKKLNSAMAEVQSQFNEMKLEIEDIQIRLERKQNAITGSL
jgi:chromosome segregation ATPase